jgi:hypothetical protein
MYPNFRDAYASVGNRIQHSSYEVHTEKWQGMDISKRPEAKMREILNCDFTVPLLGQMDLDHWRFDISPNLPWADDHFEERVSGNSLNPGETWKQWPWALAADKHRTYSLQFTHTYMERYWPKYANTEGLAPIREGIRYKYGDLWNVIDQLSNEPFTRQAYLPIFFPEDTGAVHGGRVPCTLGYHWIVRSGFLHTTYYIRSCDYYRHFKDDLYLTVRLTLWLLEKLREQDGWWNQITPGLFSFHCVSMHLFINDYRKLYGS